MISFFHRQQDWYAIDPDMQNGRGVLSLQVDGGTEYKTYLMPVHRDQPLALDRVGIFNMQLYHGVCEFDLSDVEINGAKIDLSKDPGWDSRGNHVEFHEADFQRQDFGYSQTNWAGEMLGEIGGTFSRVEPIDPLHGYYADDIGKLTLDDPISFSGNVCFTRGGTDAGMFFGFFNAAAQGELATPDNKLKEKPGGLLGINIEGPTRVGYFFTSVCAPKGGKGVRADGPVFLPTAERHKFSFDYDPKANNGSGCMTMTLDGKQYKKNLKPGNRSAGATFDHFGLLTVRSGGKYVTVYLDDLTYTARRSSDAPPTKHEQKITVVPYPENGRKY
jgi:hypothetical protein